MGVELVDWTHCWPERLHHDPPAKNKETMNLLNAESLKKTSPACASSTWRAVASSTRPTREAIRNGHVQGALDVFEKEPTTESPLFELASVVVVPHSARQPPKPRTRPA